MSEKSLPAGTYTLKNAATNSVLDLWNGESAEGKVIQGYESHGGDNQKWQLQWTGTGNSVTIRNVASGTYIGKGASGFAQSSPVLGSITAVPLLLVAADKGFAMEVAELRNTVVGLEQNSSSNTVPAVYRSNTGIDTQKWHFVKQD
ncbi:ricin-type beta-trefoil lectin domain protein [Rhizoctonia solani 123E]|uniref:Ricin-type beta-trefoil lectin domain protein n=1 Tax=Rhizoctonia solani 123E TaxID=1423351 RepID=A0A074RJ50_9AGAM|nr:ricin-type beta-trefoil lectin domain protein [Rhizoctonia solani 123E]